MDEEEEAAMVYEGGLGVKEKARDSAKGYQAREKLLRMSFIYVCVLCILLKIYLYIYIYIYICI